MTWKCSVLKSECFKSESFNVVQKLFHRVFCIKSFLYKTPLSTSIQRMLLFILKTAQSRTSSLRSFLRMAWRNERLSKDPFEGRFWLVVQKQCKGNEDPGYEGENCKVEIHWTYMWQHNNYLKEIVVWLASTKQVRDVALLIVRLKWFTWTI